MSHPDEVEDTNQDDNEPVVEDDPPEEEEPEVQSFLS